MPTETEPEVHIPLPAPQTLEESGLTLDLIVQLLVKTLHFAGELSGLELAERLGLSFTVIEQGIDFMKSQHLCEIVGGTSLGPPSYRYRISLAGRERAGLFLEQNMYSGFAPVPFEQYVRYMKEFHASVPLKVTRQQVKTAFNHLVLSDHVLDQLGPAVSAGHSLFVYGPPGNGKTVISQAIRNLLLGDLWIPHALEVDGSLIQVFDPVNHEPLPKARAATSLQKGHQPDSRWVRCRRPLVTVGGELTLEALELTYNPLSGFYRAPVQLLANGGVLVIDDFGRQRCSPHALLNRWITPLEGRIDYLSLQSGQKVAMPFMVMPVFATNLKPADLVDEAFLRRIQYKVLAESPTPQEFAQIFENCCRERGVGYDLSLVEHLLTDVYAPRHLALRGCQPRDIINQALLLAQYREEPARLTPALLEAACATYFVDEDQGVAQVA
jgi:predicted ATPase with chaperone activity